MNCSSPIPSDRGNRFRERIPPQNLIPSVVKALDVLEAFDYEREEMEVTGLAQKLGLHTNNVFRLLATLETRGYVEQDGRRGNYRLGLKTFEVGNVFLHHLGIRRQARPVLEDLVTRCNETAYLAVLDGPDVIYVLMHETTHSLRVASRLGRRLPAYCTAAGTCQLAYESQDRLNEIFRNYPLKPLTEHTITRFEDLLAHLKEISRKGYAVDDEEWEYGVRCVAAPVRDYTHRVVAAVGLTGPAPRFPSERIETELVPLVKEAAARLSQRLGYEASARVAA